ncbi:MAG TPA: peptide chain release factor N(5)-glutamine methyltransferase [Candidatus Anaerobutyricum stercoripullorum]|uniref:Release factor glutamine methyltransferase n=1 Tax=Candidatus Anaerobutyricum stercoripullorum TaxID=2838456 RepID=A0A9D2BEB7_9FIRM|nr:peptide chain release factor N(5)-glutamine methyltransferase [Candidatus Anaerobutyricum stercoripullorum]
MFVTRKEIREETARRLREAGIEEYEYETWMLLEWKLGVDRAEYFMDPDAEVPQEQWNDLDAALRKRERRIPLQYLMGSCEFMGYSFAVDERVLIPRQDTECLVELAVEQMQRSPEPCRVLDLCTGSGCIGVSVKLLCPQAQVVLSDVSEGALAVAGENARRLGAPVELVQGDLFENVQGTFDYILSNPPYIPSKVIDGLMPEVRDHEPRLALDGTEDGLHFYRRIVREATKRLRPGGRLLFEIGQEQGEALLSLLQEAGYEETVIRQDLAGLDRIAVGRWPGKKEP